MTDAAPPPPDDWKAEQPWEDDSLAVFEVQSDPLDAQLREQDKRNRLSFKKVTGRLIVASVVLFWLLITVSLIVWTWHFITPWGFLEEPQLVKIQSIIFSGTLGALISTMARGYIERDGRS